MSIVDDCISSSTCSSGSNITSDQRQTVCRLSLGQVLGTVLICSLSAFGCGLCHGYRRAKNARHVKTFEATIKAAAAAAQSLDDKDGSWSCIRSGSPCARHQTPTTAAVVAVAAPRLWDNSSFTSHVHTIVPVGLSSVFAPTDYFGAMDLLPVLVVPHNNDTVPADWPNLELQRLQSQALRPLTMARVDSKRRRKMERGRVALSLSSRYYEVATATATDAATTASLEALVHPALLTHAHPRRISIVLSMATRPLFQVEQIVRHVLLHKTVEHVHIVLIPSIVSSPHDVHDVPLQFVCGSANQTRVNFNRLSPLCDSRVVIRHVDHGKLERAATAKAAAATKSEHFSFANDWYDVVLWPDLLGSIRGTAAAATSTRSTNDTSTTDAERDTQATKLRTWCFEALKDNGIFVQQLPMISKSTTWSRTAAQLGPLFEAIYALEDVGYASIVDYSESRSYHYILAMKDSDSRERWFRNQAELNLDMAKRFAVRENDNDDRAMLPLMDGATLMQYQFTSRLVEDAWCADVSSSTATGRRRSSQKGKNDEDTVNWCGNGQHGHDPERINVPITSFDVHPSKAANLAGRGVYTTQFVAQGSALAMDEYAHYIFISSRTRRTMNDALDYFDDDEFVATFWDVVLSGYVEGYGYTCSDYGPMASGVEPGIMSFVNHGCNGTYNTGMATNETELSIALGRGPQGILTYDSLTRPYHARMARHFPSTPEDGVNFALHDLPPGTEVLDNYLVFGGIESIDYWDDNLRELQTVCSGGSGLISNYETATAQQ